MPQDDYRNGDGGTASSASRSDDSSGDEASALEEELSLEDPAAPARSLAALNALRKARQHYDVLLAVGGEELPAHRAVLAAASPRLLAALASAPRALRLPDLDPDSVRELLEYAYTGRLRVRDGAAARRLYRAAARLRLEAARAHLAACLVRRATPRDCLALRALPALSVSHRATLDGMIATHMDRLCEAGALAQLPVVHIELLREAGEREEDTPAAVADAALAWLRDCLASDLEVEELCSRTHLVFVDAGGALRDCGQLPAARGDAPELTEYRREAREREKGRRAPPAPARQPSHQPTPAPEYTLAENDDENGGGECAVIAARAEGGGAVGAVVVLRGRLLAARVARRAGGLGAGGRLPGAPPTDEADEGRIAAMSVGRCAAGGASIGDRLIVCGGYDRARVLRCAEAYDPASNSWAPLPDMSRARARFPAARLGGAVYVLGGSDGLTELDSVDVYEEFPDGGGAWKSRAKLPSARSYAAAAADDSRGALYVLGGWAAGRCLRAAHRYNPAQDSWGDAPPLTIGRSQSAGVVWEGALWALGGTDGWNCLASTEMLPLDDPQAVWKQGPSLPTARRSVGGAVWRGLLVSAGGSGGAASLRAADCLAPRAAAWRPLPPLRRPRAAPSLVTLGEVLYAAGGFSGKEFLSCVECLSDPEGQWTTLWTPPSLHDAPTPLTAPPATVAPLTTTAPPIEDSDRNKTQVNGTTE